MSKKQQDEHYRRKANYNSFDKILSRSHGGDIVDMHKWLFKQRHQFSTEDEFNQIKSDFNLWMLDRKISIHE